MNIQSLIYFASAAKHSSFAKAAEERLIAQSAMSRQIAEIEKELGVKLFSRFNRKVTLTPAGESFYREVQAILIRYRDAVHLAKDIDRGYDESLSIGFGIFDAPIASVHVKTFAALSSNVSITLNQYPYDTLIKNLKDGLCDIVFCPLTRTTNLKGVRMLHVKKTHRSVAVSKASPLAHKSELEPRDLEQQVFINPAEVDSEVFRTFCAKEGFVPRRTLGANTLEAILTLVEAGFGMAIVPDFLKGTINFEVEIVPMKTGKYIRMHAVISLNSNSSKAVNKFMRMSDEHYRIDGDQIVSYL